MSKGKRVLMKHPRRSMFYFPAEDVPRHEAQGWEKATAADVKGTGYELHINDDQPTTKTNEKGA